jgi:hypothetical protein
MIHYEQLKFMEHNKYYFINRTFMLNFDSYIKHYMHVLLSEPLIE